jgi:predicted SPOUT superfamily RNA methylase MTH1
MEEFYCFSCGKHKSIGVRSNKKIGRYKSLNLCIPCDEKAKKKTAISKRNPEELLGYQGYKVKHIKRALNNHNKKLYLTDVVYKQFKKREIIE